MAIRIVEVEVDLDDFSDEDLLEEIEHRDLGVAPSQCKEMIEEMFYALKFGHQEKALELARKIAEEHTGRILP